MTNPETETVKSTVKFTLTKIMMIFHRQASIKIIRINSSSAMHNRPTVWPDVWHQIMTEFLALLTCTTYDLWVREKRLSIVFFFFTLFFETFGFRCQSTSHENSGCTQKNGTAWASKKTLMIIFKKNHISRIVFSKKILILKRQDDRVNLVHENPVMGCGMTTMLDTYCNTAQNVPYASFLIGWTLIPVHRENGVLTCTTLHNSRTGQIARHRPRISTRNNDTVPYTVRLDRAGVTHTWSSWCAVSHSWSNPHLVCTVPFYFPL